MPDWPTIPGRQVLNLVTDYGVSPSNTAAANTTAITNAFTDAAKNGFPVYLPGNANFYPCNTLTLPSEPFTFFGDGPTVSLLGTTNGTILTYSPTVSPLTGATDPWSINSSSMVSAIAYKSKTWNLYGLGFTKTDNWSGSTGIGLDFSTNWTISDKLSMWMQNCIISNFNGTGFSFLVNGGRQESVFINVLADGNAHEGVIYGSDQWWIGCHSNNNGYEGFWADGRNGMLVSCKAFNNGSLNKTTRNAGFHYRNSSGGAMITSCHAQDNQGPGLEIVTAARISVQGFICDRNCWFNNTADATKQSGVEITDSTDVAIEGLVATDSYVGTKNNVQKHAVKVFNTGGTTNARNLITLKQSAGAGTQTLAEPVDPASDLNGTHVMVDAVELAFSSRTPVGMQFVQPNGSVQVNRKYSLDSTDKLALGLGAIFRII